MSEREAWQQGYDQGVLDARTADALQVDVGLGIPAQPNRQNPYGGPQPVNAGARDE